ncbi:hypothetical protein W822_12460 [Advenella kashmirensis W13003]|uniref:Lipoprotein n=1 Tax=Advenella kashmirensis W13003 TaxID=1424334 RepID=V8QTL4_9BURK|nr:hypothetical protein [Advenella kashmirensis]ETF02349.1 hypothetical protein W822_12460 [Advenella kashmirensis W13003]
MKKTLLMISVALGTLTGCVGYAGDGYGRYADRYDNYGPGTTYYGGGYNRGYRNVDYRRHDRRDWERRQDARRDAARREARRDRNDWRDRRDHDRGNSWNRPSNRETMRNLHNADRRLKEMRSGQNR